MTAVLAAMEPVDFRVVWEVDLLAIPEVVVSRVVIFLEEVRVVEGFLIIPEVAVSQMVIFLRRCSWWWAWRSTWRSPPPPTTWTAPVDEGGAGELHLQPGHSEGHQG